MELRQLRYFARVARELNFTRAARQLRVAQPALSRQIRQLEDELGGELFERDKRRVVLTARGRMFLERAVAILDQADRAVADARAGELLTVGYVWGLFHSIAPVALQRLRASFPHVSAKLVDMSAREQSDALSAGRIDFGFIGMSLEADTAELEKQRIGECHFAIVLPKDHRYARRKQVDLSLLQQELFLHISEEHFPAASQLIQRACEAAGFRPRVLQVAERGHTILSLVSAGCGVALLPDTLRALPHEGVVFRQPAHPLQTDLYVAWRRGLEPDIVQRFVGCIPA